MDNAIKAARVALVPGLLALVGVRASEVLGIKSQSWKLLAAAAGAIGGVMLASKLN
jgi:hypothetical protein